MPYIKSLCNFKMDKELCRTCGKLVPKKNFARHLKSHSDDKKFSCFQCSKRFKRKDKLNCHLQTHRKPEDIKCQYCNHVLHSSRALTKHVKSYHEKYHIHAVTVGKASRLQNIARNTQRHVSCQFPVYV